jgi:hypothetical protein
VRAAIHVGCALILGHLDGVAIYSTNLCHWKKAILTVANHSRLENNARAKDRALATFLAQKSLWRALFRVGECETRRFNSLLNLIKRIASFSWQVYGKVF